MSECWGEEGGDIRRRRKGKVHLVLVVSTDSNRFVSNAHRYCPVQLQYIYKAATGKMH